GCPTKSEASLSYGKQEWTGTPLRRTEANRPWYCGNGFPELCTGWLSRWGSRRRKRGWGRKSPTTGMVAASCLETTSSGSPAGSGLVLDPLAKRLDHAGFAQCLRQTQKWHQVSGT